jgi:hypothetical protein
MSAYPEQFEISHSIQKRKRDESRRMEVTTGKLERGRGLLPGNSIPIVICELHSLGHYEGVGVGGMECIRQKCNGCTTYIEYQGPHFAVS